MKKIYLLAFAVLCAARAWAAVPDSVTNITATPGAEGALNATLQFTLPTKAVDGSALTDSVQVRIVHIGKNKRVGNTAGVPGQRVSVTVNTSQGDNALNIIPGQGSDQGNPTKISVYTGVDQPLMVANPHIVMDEDNMHGTFCWEAPKEGVHGGYFPTTGITYWLSKPYYGLALWIRDKMIGVDVFSMPIEAEQDTAQVPIYLGVTAETAGGSTAGLLPCMTGIGKPHALPITETWDSCRPMYEPFFLQPERYQQYLTGSSIDTQENPEKYKGVPNRWVFESSRWGGDKPVLRTPKFGTSGAETVKLSFCVDAGRVARLNVTASTYGVNEEVVYTMPEGLSGYKTFDVELPAKFGNRKWIELQFRPELDDEHELFVLANYSLSNASGVAGIEAGKGTVEGAQGCIVINGYEGQVAQVYTPSGTRMTSVRCSGHERVALPSGIYLVRVGASASKIRVG